MAALAISVVGLAASCSEPDLRSEKGDALVSLACSGARDVYLSTSDITDADQDAYTRLTAAAELAGEAATGIADTGDFDLQYEIYPGNISSMIYRMRDAIVDRNGIRFAEYYRGVEQLCGEFYEL